MLPVIEMYGYALLRLKLITACHSALEDVYAGIMRICITQPKTEDLMQSMTMLELIQIYG